MRVCVSACLCVGEEAPGGARGCVCGDAPWQAVRCCGWLPLWPPCAPAPAVGKSRWTALQAAAPSARPGAAPPPPSPPAPPPPAAVAAAGGRGGESECEAVVVSRLGHGCHRCAHPLLALDLRLAPLPLLKRRLPLLLAGLWAAVRAAPLVLPPLLPPPPPPLLLLSPAPLLPAGLPRLAPVPLLPLVLLLLLLQRSPHRRVVQVHPGRAPPASDAARAAAAGGKLLQQGRWTEGLPGGHGRGSQAPRNAQWHSARRGAAHVAAPHALV